MAGPRNEKRFIECKQCGTVLVEYKPVTSIQRRAMVHNRKCKGNEHGSISGSVGGV